MKVGDIVKISRKVEDDEDGWGNWWSEYADTWVGKTGEITKDGGGCGFRVFLEEENDCWYFPYFVLEKVEENETPKGMKFDEDKLRYDLIPPEVLLWLAELYTHGAKKYAPDNWKNVSTEQYVAAFHRHFNDWRLGIDLDKDSSMHHLKHALWNAATIAWLEIEGKKPKG